MKKNIIGSILLCCVMFFCQINVYGQESRINTYLNEMGLDDAGIQSIENILIDNGIEKENLDLVKRCIISIVREIPSGSREFELSDKIKNHLQEIGVKPSQIGIIKRLALRISIGHERNNQINNKR